MPSTKTITLLTEIGALISISKYDYYYRYQINKCNLIIRRLAISITHELHSSECVCTELKKRCRVIRENHRRCDTMGFWEDGTGKLETRFRLLFFNTFSLRITFQSIASHLVLLKGARFITMGARFGASQKSDGAYR